MVVRRTVERAFRRLWSFVAALTVTLADSMKHSRGGSWGISLLNRTSINYGALVRPDANSIVQAAIRWAQRNSSEAPLMLEQWNPDRQDWDQFHRDGLLDLLEKPNPFYDGDTLMRATIADLMAGDGGGGNAYWLKVRSRTGRLVQLWWVPAHMIQPKDDPNDPTVFISHYEYSPGAGAPIPLRVEDVVHFRDGMDPDNPRLGMTPMKALFREIFTDDEAANMTAVLLKNAGVPGVIITPEHGTITPEAAEEIKQKYLEKFGGDKRGEPMVMAGAAKVTQFGFSPEQMQLRSLRGIPEERITALIGINSAVLGLGAGLATTKVGATLREYREEATESFMVPLWKQLGRTLTHQLLTEFRSGTDWRLVFDLSKVRVLQDDEDRRAEHLGKRLEAGGITVAEYRRALGMVAKEEHEVYLRRAGVRAIPAGLSPQEQAAMSAGPGSGNAEPLDEKAVLEEAERAVRP